MRRGRTHVVYHTHICSCLTENEGLTSVDSVLNLRSELHFDDNTRCSDELMLEKRV